MAVDAKATFVIDTQTRGLKQATGQTQRLGTSIDRTSTSLDKLGVQQDRYNTGAKGVAGATSNSTKAFSKMNEQIGSGFVGAYATLAANLFAATALFNAFRRAASVEKLIEGLDAVGASSGINLKRMSEGLREVTDNAISAEQAMRAMAVGTSAGFSIKQMNDLARVAKGASIALGRDLGDAMDRLTRGAAKLEPEILDELGIMVRLDDATEAYARTLGKTASQLTQFERRMGFLNAINEQGARKFGDIADQADPNPFDQLAAALTNLQHEFMILINEYLTPMIKFFSSNKNSLMGAVGLFAAMLVKSFAPALGTSAANLAKVAEAQTNMNIVSQQGLLDNNLLAKSSEVQSAVNNKRALSTKQLNTLLDQSNVAIAKLTASQERQAKTSGLNNKALDSTTLKLRQAKQARDLLTIAIQEQNVVLASNSQAKLANLSATQALTGSQGALGSAFKTATAASGAVGTLRGTLAGIGASIKGLFGLLSRFIFGLPGMLLMIGGPIIYDLFFKNKNEAGELAEDIFKINDMLQKFKRTKEKFEEDRPVELIDLQLGQISGIISQIDIEASQFASNKRLEAAKKILEIEKEISDIKDKNTTNENDSAKKRVESSKRFVVNSARATITDALKTAQFDFADKNFVAKIKKVSDNLAQTDINARALPKPLSNKDELLALQDLFKEYNTTKKAFDEMFKKSGDDPDLFNAENAKAYLETLNKMIKPLSIITEKQLKTIEIPTIKNIDETGAVGLVSESAQLKQLNTDRENLLKDVEEKTKKSLEAVLTNLNNTLNKELDKNVEGTFEGTLYRRFQKEVDKILKGLTEGTTTSEAAGRTFEEIRRDFMNLKGAVDEATQASNNYDDATNKILNRKRTPFDDAVKTGNEMEKILQNLENSLDSNFLNLTDIQKNLKRVQVARELGVDLLKTEQDGNKSNLEIVRKFGKDLRHNRKAQIESVAIAKDYEAVLKRISKIQTGTSAQIEFSDKQQNNAIAFRVAAKQAEINQLELIARKELNRLENLKSQHIADKNTEAQTQAQLELTRYQEKHSSEINKLIFEKNALLEKEITKAETIAAQTIAEEKMALKINDSLRDRLQAQKEGIKLAEDSKKINEEINKLQNNPARVSRRGSDQTAAERYIFLLNFETRRIQAINKEEELLKEKLRIETLITKANFTLMKAQLEAMKTREQEEEGKNAIQAIIDELKTDDFINRLTKVEELQKSNIKQTAQNNKDALKLEILKAKNDLTRNRISEETLPSSAGTFEAMDTLFDDLAARRALKSELQLEADKPPVFVQGSAVPTTIREGLETGSGVLGIGASLPGLTDEDRAMGFTSDQDIENAKRMTDNILASKQAMDELGISLSNLKFDNATEGAKSLAGATGAIAGVASSLFTIQKEGTLNQIKGIDSELEMLKKKGNLTEDEVKQKQQLEAKKLQLERKAFDQNKKALIAKTVMNASLAIVKALSEGGPFLGPALAVMVGAMAAKQISTIQSQTFQGGGSSSAEATAPTRSEVSMGERGNIIDLARTSGMDTRDELSYLRGAEGSGEVGNYRSAFAGYKNRASGGDAYVVGEQGPELFVPSVEGSIIPNNQITGRGAATNVTFNIQTIDATDMEGALNRQRGNIISMIRSAANEAGEGFLESVDTFAVQGSGGY